MIEIVPGKYKHYKGSIYTVLCMATHSETGDSLVIYQKEHECCWARPVGMFKETVKLKDGTEVNRFSKIDD